MGIDFSHGDASWSYSGFNRFRKRLAQEILKGAREKAKKRNIKIWIIAVFATISILSIQVLLIKLMLLATTLFNLNIINDVIFKWYYLYAYVALANLLGGFISGILQNGKHKKQKMF